MSLLRYSHLQNESSHCGQNTAGVLHLAMSQWGISPHKMYHWEPGRSGCIPSHPFFSAPQASKTDSRGGASFHQTLIPWPQWIWRGMLSLESPWWILTCANLSLFKQLGGKDRFTDANLRTYGSGKSKFSLGITFLNKTHPFSALLFIRAGSLYCSFPI